MSAKRDNKTTPATSSSA